MAKPIKLPIWNTNETNVAEPSASRQSDGWTITGGIPEKPPVEWHNYIWNLQYKWFQYLDEIVDEKNSKFGIDIGVVNAIQIDNVDYTSLVDNMIIEFTPAFANTGATTLKVKTLIAKDLKYNGLALTAGFLATDSKYIAIYSVANNRFDVDLLVNYKNLNDAISGIDLSAKADKIEVIGINQTWQDVTASRSFGVTYTNTTGKPIFIKIQASSTASWGWSISVDGISVGYYQPSASGYGATLYAIVPDGSTYINNASGSGYNISSWTELR